MKIEKEITARGLLPALPLPRLLRQAGVVSVLGAVVAVIADIILQYDPQGRYGTTIPLNIASWRVYAGHFLGIASIPIEIVGYWLVCRLLLPYAPRFARLMFWVMAYDIVIGTVFHGMFLPLLFSERAEAVLGAAYPLVALLQAGILPLAVFFLLVYLAMWSVFIIIVLRKIPPTLPRWLIVLVPAVGSALIALLYESHLVPVLANVLFPTVLSLPHLVFFGVLTILVWRKVWSL